VHYRVSTGGYLARFDKHRDVFEQAASAKHQRQQLEDQIDLRVIASDQAGHKRAGNDMPVANVVAALQR
jgi:hypothetical protein